MDSAPSIQYEKIINTINPDINYTRNFEISSDKKNKYKISIFTKEDKLKITALNLNSTDIKSNEYGKEILMSELKKNKYLSLCETNKDMLEELFNLIDNKKYTLTEEENNEISLSIEVPMKVIKEIKFNLEKKEKDLNFIINDLIEENKELKSKIEVLTLQCRDLKDDIDYLKDKNADAKINELNNKLNEKFSNFELKINQEKLQERKEKNELISQVNILTKKVLQLEKDVEQEKNNNKKLQENKNNNPLRTPNPNANVNKPNNPPPPFHTSKSDSIPNILFKNLFGSVFGLPELGKKGRSKLHEHILVYSNYEMKDPSYSECGYSCDNCGEKFTRDVDNFHCKPCGFDLCMRCFKQSQY